VRRVKPIGRARLELARDGPGRRRRVEPEYRQEEQLFRLARDRPVSSCVYYVDSLDAPPCERVGEPPALLFTLPVAAGAYNAGAMTVYDAPSPASLAGS